MAMLLPVALYGLEIPPGGFPIPAMQEDSFPEAAYRITMAALDPTQAPEADEDGNIPAIPRATLKLVRQKYTDLDDEVDDEYLEQLMGGSDESDSDEDSDGDEPNGGPSDPSKTKKAKAEAALKKLIEAAQEEEDSDEEMADDAEGKTNGVSKAVKKGKEPATSSDDDDDESLDGDELDMEEFVICTLDTERNYQQPIDITIGPNEKVYFTVTGTHTIHLTGNYIIDTSEDIESSSEDDDEEYDFPDALEEMYGEGSDESEDDELDGLEDPRIKEIESDEEDKAAPKAPEPKKGKNKRPADDEVEGLDDMMAKAATEQTKLTKKQQKKLKNNKGEPIAVEEKTASEKSPKDAKADKKVQFAKNLEQGPTGSAATAAEKGATVGVKVVQGVTIDDRKIGSGRVVKSGNKVGVRYIGKLQSNGKVFDSNKKGKPFTFAAGKGEVIKGWDIGVVGMSVGGERRLTIPASLAYGSKGVPGIPPNSTLIFDIKLLEIK